MYINLKLFFRALEIALFEKPASPRRWFFVIAFTGLFLAFWCVVAAGRLLDHLLYPGYRDQPVKEPVFIIAPPRSGTTITQKLMALDEERFSCVRFYQCVFPAVTFHKIFNAIAWIDKQLGDPFAQLATWMEKLFFGGWEDSHPMKFNEPEEDDGFFVYTFVTEAIYLLFPYVNELWGAGFMDDLSHSERRQVMRYYRSCLQRHLYATGPDKTQLSKATQLSGAFNCIREEFPDAKMITIIRHPRNSIPSHVSLFVPVWQTVDPIIKRDGPESREYAEIAVAWFKHMYQASQEQPTDRFYTIRFNELASDNQGTIEKVYQHFGWPISDALRERHETAGKKGREFKSSHKYTLEEFGLSEEWVQTECKEVIEGYGLQDR